MNEEFFNESVVFTEKEIVPKILTEDEIEYNVHYALEKTKDLYDLSLEIARETRSSRSAEVANGVLNTLLNGNLQLLKNRKEKKQETATTIAFTDILSLIKSGAV